MNRFSFLVRLADVLDAQGKHEEADSIDAILKDKARKMQYRDMDQDKAYDMFRDSYQASTGNSWDRGKFDSRAHNWSFWGDDKGYVAGREQPGGLVKLTGSAGHPKSIMEGMKALLASNAPVWGMVNEPIRDMMVKRGFVSPSPKLINMVLKFIPHSQAKKMEGMFNSATGAATMSYSDVGSMDKYFVASKSYFKWILEQLESNPEWKARFDAETNWATKKAVIFGLKQLAS